MLFTCLVMFRLLLLLLLHRRFFLLFYFRGRCEKYAEDPLEAAAEWNAMDSASSEASGNDYGYEYYYWDDWSAWDGSSSGSTVGSDKQAAFVEPQPAEPGRVLFTYDITWKPSKVGKEKIWRGYASLGFLLRPHAHAFHGPDISSFFLSFFLSHTRQHNTIQDNTIQYNTILDKTKTRQHNTTQY